MSYMKDALESSKGGSAGEYYWITGRRYVETHGIRYEFHKEETEHVSPDTKKYFFVRVKPSGEQMGYPLPITLKKDTDDKWKVDTATQ